MAQRSGATSSQNSDFDQQEEILRRLKDSYSLPDAHVQYLAKEVDDALDCGNQDKQREMLNQVENDARTAPYLLVAKVGHGAFGEVYRGINRQTGKTVAIKIIDLESTKDDISTINREIVALTNGQICAQLVRYFGSIVFGARLWIIMEFVDGGSVLGRVRARQLSEGQVAIIVREVLLGLKFLWKEKKIHRDIKCANILLSKSGQVKLADFGATAQLTDTMTKCNTFVGSPFWMAPEVLTGSKYDGKADIWSLGITCLEMVDPNGQPPNHQYHQFKVINIIPTQPPPRLEGDQWSKAFKNFVSLCLVKDPSKRPSVDELLKHPFIKGAGRIDELQSLFDDVNPALANQGRNSEPNSIARRPGGITDSQMFQQTDDYDRPNDDQTVRQMKPLESKLDENESYTPEEEVNRRTINQSAASPASAVDHQLAQQFQAKAQISGAGRSAAPMPSPGAAALYSSGPANQFSMRQQAPGSPASNAALAAAQAAPTPVRKNPPPAAQPVQQAYRRH